MKALHNLEETKEKDLFPVWKLEMATNLNLIVEKLAPSLKREVG